MAPGIEQQIAGCILDTAVADALGLSLEGLSKRRQAKMQPKLTGYKLIFGKGLTSDDTEHTSMVAQTLIVSAGDPKRYVRSLGWRFRFWLLGLPAGIGLATLRSILKLWLGFPPQKSGVFSAGNGPAMRSALLGVCFGSEPARLHEMVHLTTWITHTDPKARYGALAVALAAHMNARDAVIDERAYLATLATILVRDDAEEFLSLMSTMIDSFERGETTAEYAERIGCGQGISGYVYHTVPTALHAWLRYPRDYAQAVTSIIQCGGDSDTTAAIVGGIVGAGVGKTGIPQRWLQDLWEWPRSIKFMERVAGRLAQVCDSGTPDSAVRLFVPGLMVRNALFMIIVLLHGFRRLLPPY